jgi:cytochrome c biogenesis protein CcdA
MRVILFTAGAILGLAGTIFLLQGLGFIAGSFMTSETRWVHIGAGMDVVAVGLWTLAACRSRKTTL